MSNNPIFSCRRIESYLLLHSSTLVAPTCSRSIGVPQGAIRRASFLGDCFRVMCIVSGLHALHVALTDHGMIHNGMRIVLTHNHSTLSLHCKWCRPRFVNVLGGHGSELWKPFSYVVAVRIRLLAVVRTTTRSRR